MPSRKSVIKSTTADDIVFARAIALSTLDARTLMCAVLFLLLSLIPSRPVRACLSGSKAGSQAILFWAVKANPSLAGIGTTIQPRRFPAGRGCRNSRGVRLPNSCGSAFCRQKGFDHAHQPHRIKRKFLRSMDDGPRIGRGRGSWVRNEIPCPNGRRVTLGLLLRTKLLVLSPAMQFCPRRYTA